MYYQDTISEEMLQEQMTTLAQTNSPIILFGTMAMGKIGKRAVEYLQKQVTCFCDNDKSKQGTEIEGIPVLSLEDVKKNYSNAKVYICSFNKNNIKTINKQLVDIGFEGIYDFSLLLWIYQIKIIKRNISIDDFADILESIYCKDDRLILRNVGVMVTEKCTLRCKNCGSLIPYFKTPHHYNKEEIIRSMKKLSDCVDVIESIGIFGGEPLLYPDLIEICKEAMNLKNVRDVGIITNGTIVPNKEILKSLSELGIIVTISNYGEFSRKIKELEHSLITHNIVYEIFGQNDRWYYSGLPRRHNRTYEENVKLFRECFTAKKCPLLQKGKLFICGYHASIETLELFSGSNEDYIDLINNIESAQEIRKQIKNLFYNRNFLEVCDYCELCEKILVLRAEQLSD